MNLLFPCREERIEQSGPLGRGQVQNTELEKLERELERAIQLGIKDAFLLYVYGLVLSDRCVQLS